MRKITTAVTAAALALSMLSMAIPAAAVAGFDSNYAGESAFVNIQAGQTRTFQVFFSNTGTTTWTRGTSTQVDLAACLEDKVTCNSQDASEATWNTGWISAVRYATTAQATVAPGSLATFSYDITAPANVAAGTYRFNGDLVLSTTGEKIHPEGYYQEATVIGGSSAAALDATPNFQFRQIGQNATITITTTNSTGTAAADVAFTCNVASAALVGGQTVFNPALTFTGTTGAAGTASITYTRANPGNDTITCYVNANPIARDTVTVQFGLAGQVLSLGPDTAETNAANGTDCRTYTITVLDPATGAAVSGAVVTIDYVESGVPAGVTRNPAGPTYTTGTGGTATFDLCSTAAATVTPRATYTSGGVTYTDNGGTKTFSTPVATTATISPASATNAPSTNTTTASTMDNSFGEEAYTLTIRDQFGTATTPAGSTTFTVTASGGTVYIVACGATPMSVAIPAGGSSSACVTAGAPHSVTIDSATGGAAATITGSFTPTGGSAITSNSATKSWVTTVFTAAPTSGSVSGTVTFVDKRATGCLGSSAANPAGFYGLTAGSSTYLIPYYGTATFAGPEYFAVGGVQATCEQFEVALSNGDVVVYTPGGAGAFFNHNMTTNSP